MSYEKAIKHHRNIRKCKKQRTMYMGFDTGSGIKESALARDMTSAIMEVRSWFASRHDGDTTYNRECIREAVDALRSLKLKMAA